MDSLQPRGSSPSRHINVSGTWGLTCTDSSDTQKSYDHGNLRHYPDTIWKNSDHCQTHCSNGRRSGDSKLGGRHPVEASCRGFTVKSKQQFLKTLGMTRSKQKALKVLAEDVEQVSFWLWLRTNGSGKSIFGPAAGTVMGGSQLMTLQVTWQHRQRGNRR